MKTFKAEVNCICGSEAIIEQSETRLSWLARCLKCGKKSSKEVTVPLVQLSWKALNK